MNLRTGQVELGVRSGTTLSEADTRAAVESAGLTLQSLVPPAATPAGP